MPELKNVVPDVYSMLGKLNNGEDLKETLVPHLPQFLAEIEEAVTHWATPQTKGGLRMSNIGKPKRQLYFDLKAGEGDISEEHPSLQIKFLYGHIIEALVLFLVKAAGHKVENQQKEVEVDGIVGHIDCTIDDELVDVKSASQFSFNKFVSGTIPEDDPFGYMAQIAGYEKALGTNEGGNLVMNKVTGELCLFIPEFMDKPNITQIIKEAKELENLDIPPDFCYPDVAEGKSGNRVVNRKCTFCPHIQECHKESNDGMGLRAFRYSNGIKYFTEVIKEPKVEEIK